MSETPTLDQNPSFLFSAHCEVRVVRYERAVLSVPSLARGERLGEKDLLAGGEAPVDGKYTLEEHLQHLESRQAIRSDRPLLVLGFRNNLVNLRAPIIMKGQAFAVEGEEPGKSQRSYYGIGLREGRLVIDRALAEAGKPEDWPEFFCAGVPVLWDDLDDNALLGLMLGETADHSHLYDLPRGHHPRATPDTLAAWQRLHGVFVEHRHADRETIQGAMRRELAGFTPPLRRCDDYFHAILGACDDASLVCLFAHGRLEDLGRMLASRGCRRAVCVENSGSIMPTFLPRGLKGQAVPLVRAPNFRPRGRAALVIELTSADFDSLPLLKHLSTPTSI